MQIRVFSFRLEIRPSLGPLCALAIGAMVPPLVALPMANNLPMVSQDSLTWIEPQSDVTLAQALALAQARNPTLRARVLEWRSLEARTLQATSRINPELLVDVEDALGSGPYRGMNQSQTTIQVEQALEFGGKRQARLKVARAEIDAFAHQVEQAKWEVVTQTTLVFVRLLAAQEEWLLRQEDVILATQSATTLASQVQVGKLAPFIALRAKTEAGSARIALEWARHELDEAREALAAQWGSHPPRFKSAVGSLECGPPPPPLETLFPTLQRNPQWKWADAQINERRSQAALEQSMASLNLSLRAGYRRLSGPGENAAVMGVAVPLPLFPRNQGRIQETRQRVTVAESEAKATHLGLTEALAEAHDVMLTAQAEWALLQDTVLPAAKAAYDNVLPGFQSGRYSHFELLDTRRTYLATQLQELKSRVTYHKAKAELEGLLAEPLKTSTEKNSP